MTRSQFDRVSPLDLPADDLDRCHDILGISAWQILAGKNIFISGGTGFIGKWLLGTLLDANETMGLACSITVLSRDPASFQCRWPGLAGRINWIAGDVRDFPISDQHFDVIVHAATDVVSQASPTDVFSTCIDGTSHMLAMARKCGASLFLLVSSGAVYGPLPVGMTNVPESYVGGPDPLLSSSAYGEGKRAAEWLASEASADGLDVKIARVFALVGPHLPMDRHFAIGNFLHAAMDGKQIVIQGDGTPFRSYLYAADMAAWLWTILIKGEPGCAYNVGSEESLSISALAERVCSVLKSSSRIKVLKQVQQHMPSVHYVPNTARARTELNLPPALALDETILRTANWHKIQQ
jgi:nucleoside-diphosphate-sugar epimerase